MIRDALHRIAANPAVYNAIQHAVGAMTIREKLREQIDPPIKPNMVVADIGGGTGIYRHIWPGDTHYLNIDLDPAKLQGFRTQHPHDAPIRADGAHIPLATNSCDAALVAFVLHHLDHAPARQLLSECARILKPNATCLIIDPLWTPNRLRSRLLWALDRGSYPRTPEQLDALTRELFHTLRITDTFVIHHAYWLCAAQVSQADMQT